MTFQFSVWFYLWSLVLDIGSIQCIGLKIKWSVLGPFACSMNEMDGSPKLFSEKNNLMSAKIPSKLTKDMLNKNYYTEFKHDGITKWKGLAEASDAFTVSFPDVQWQSLVQSLSSTEALQWQAWIVGEFFISEDQTLIEITCVGINTYWVDDKGPI